jgi:nucleotide-binding universal stress UspA family protein
LAQLLVAYDGSELADHAVTFAISMAKAYGDEIIVLNVQPNLQTYNTKRFFNQEEILAYQKTLAEDTLAPAVKNLAEAGVPFQARHRIGNPKIEICEEAKLISARSIIIGSRGMDAVIGKIMGSVSYGVLYLAPCPVIVVP